MAEAVKHLTGGVDRRGSGARDVLLLGSDLLRLPHRTHRMGTGSGEPRQAQAALAMKHLGVRIHCHWGSAEFGPLV